MAYTSAQILALESAIATGALEVEYADKKVKYRSLEEMQQLLATMQAQGSSATRSTRKFAAISKGTHPC